MDVVVTGIGLRCCLGNLAQSWQCLVAGKSGIQRYQPFPELPAYPMGLIENSPILLNRLVQLVVEDALADAQLYPLLAECGIVIGSSRGCQALWEQLARQMQQEGCLPQNEVNWLETLPHQAAIIAARQVGTAEIVLSPMAACVTGLWAIAQGVDLIQQGRCQQVLAGAVEAPITPLTLTGFQQMGALAATGCYPFDKDREGLVLGEGGAVLLLESAEVARRRGASIYGRILGCGFTCDAYHLTAPAPDYHSGAIALKQSLKRAHLAQGDLDYLHAHGTSTPLNDRREAALIASLFPPSLPVSSTKGATGHTLGASGAMGVAFCLMALKYQQLPPCIGLNVPEFTLNLVTHARPSQIKQAMCLGFGFGGQNAAIALGRGLSTKHIAEQR